MPIHPRRLRKTARLIAAPTLSYSAAITLMVQLAPASFAAARPNDEPHAHSLRDTVVIVPEASRISTLHADGRRIIVPVESVWRPMCYSAPGALTHAGLQKIAADVRTQAQAHPRPTQSQVPPMLARSGDSGGVAGGPGEGGGLDIAFDLDASVPAEADEALDRVEAFFEQQFDDDITVTINLEYDDTLPGGVLGATGTPYTHVSWNLSRNGLQNDMDESDRIQNHLPPGSTIPVRYNGNSPFVSSETRVFWTIANYNAAIGFISGDAGSMRFNADIDWDYDPDDGVAGYSFVDVLIHEIGHVLGFDSGVDFRDFDIETLDIYRFQRTDGIAPADYNPDTYAEFGTTPRLADYNLPNNNVVSDLIQFQYKMEDGFPYQASHFFDKQPSIGIMDPVLGQGQTFAPKFFTPADKRMFDAIGWDR